MPWASGLRSGQEMQSKKQRPATFPLTCAAIGAVRERNARFFSYGSGGPSGVPNIFRHSPKRILAEAAVGGVTSGSLFGFNR